jgi:hypothetical protein
MAQVSMEWQLGSITTQQARAETGADDCWYILLWAFSLEINAESSDTFTLRVDRMFKSLHMPPHVVALWHLCCKRLVCKRFLASNSMPP